MATGLFGHSENRAICQCKMEQECPTGVHLLLSRMFEIREDREKSGRRADQRQSKGRVRSEHGGRRGGKKR